MTETLADKYPEAAPYIQEAVDEHGEDWVLENYYEQLYPLGRVMEMPEKDELPFYDPDEHDTMTEAERVEMYRSCNATTSGLDPEGEADNFPVV